MKRKFILFLMLIPLLIIAQEDSSSNENKPLSIGISFSPNYDNNQKIFFGGVNPVGQVESSNLLQGFNTGIIFRYQVLEKLEVELGFQFSRRAYWAKDISYFNSNQIGNLDFGIREHYFEMPILLNYTVIKKKYFFYMSAGASINDFLYYDNVQKIEYINGDKQRIVYTPDASGIENELTYSAIGGFGVGREIKDKISVRAQPIIRYDITHIIENTTSSEAIFSIGLNLSCALRL